MTLCKALYQHCSMGLSPLHEATLTLASSPVVCRPCVGWCFNTGLLNPSLVCSSLKQQGQGNQQWACLHSAYFPFMSLRQFNTSSTDNIGHPFSPYLRHLTSILFFMLLHYCYCMHVHEVYECASVAQRIYGGQLTTVYSQFSPTFVKVPGIEPRS